MLHITDLVLSTSVCIHLTISLHHVSKYCPALSLITSEKPVLHKRVQLRKVVTVCSIPRCGKYKDFVFKVFRDNRECAK